jgi:uncharacterized protein (DUF1501 family)
MKQNRREFLTKSGCALGMTALATQMRHFGIISAFAQERADARESNNLPPDDYKALVCVFLGGGNDGNNTVVPKYNSGYAEYLAARQAQGLAIGQNQLLSITPPSIGLEFGLNPNLSELQILFQQNKLAVVCNAGTLVQPLTRSQFLAGAARPQQLFSHSNQVEQHQTSIAINSGVTGWGGRIADRTAGQNPNGVISMISSIAGATIFNVGNNTSPLIVTTAPTPLNQVFALEGFGAGSDEIARRAAMNRIRQYDLNYSLVRAASELTQQAVSVSEQLSSDPALAVAFPDTALGNQLKQVAKLMRFRTQLGMKRQIFYVQLNGFDTHTSQLSLQSSLLRQFSQAMKAFYDETEAQGIASQVTTFTLSDFSRTLNPSGAGGGVGSDHAWANHHFVMGGAVRGGDFYGQPTSNGSIFPSLITGAADDAEIRGRLIPTVSVEMYAATLSRWYGLNETDIPLVFPLINRFPTSNLNFMI